MLELIIADLDMMYIMGLVALRRIAMDNIPDNLTVALFDEILKFMLSNPTLEQIIAFRLPSHLENQVHNLFELNRAGTLPTKEKAGMEELLRINHFITMLKARAHNKLRTR